MLSFVHFLKPQELELEEIVSPYGKGVNDKKKKAQKEVIRTKILIDLLLEKEPKSIFLINKERLKKREIRREHLLINKILFPIISEEIMVDIPKKQLIDRDIVIQLEKPIKTEKESKPILIERAKPNSDILVVEEDEPTIENRSLLIDSDINVLKQKSIFLIDKKKLQRKEIQKERNHLLINNAVFPIVEIPKRQGSRTSILIEGVPFGRMDFKVNISEMPEVDTFQYQEPIEFLFKDKPINREQDSPYLAPIYNEDVTEEDMALLNMLEEIEEIDVSPPLFIKKELKVQLKQERIEESEDEDYEFIVDLASSLLN